LASRSRSGTRRDARQHLDTLTKLPVGLLLIPLLATACLAEAAVESLGPAAAKKLPVSGPAANTRLPYSLNVDLLKRTDSKRHVRVFTSLE